MASPVDLVLGLVTHSHSRYRHAGEQTAHTVAAALEAQGLRTEVIISDRNDADPNQYRIDRALILRTAQHQAALEARWRKHLSYQWGGPIGDPVLTLAMATRRAMGSPDGLMRLLNIDLSHLRIWRTALAQGAMAALVLEDDADLLTTDIGAIFADVMPLIAHQQVLINCSASIDAETLGAQHLLQDAPTTAISPHHLMRHPSRAVTNTVCANLYSAEFLAALVSFIDSRGLVPIAPIDWRVNEFLLENPQAHTWWLDPAPFRQGSMHD